MTAPRKPFTCADESIWKSDSDIEIQHPGLVDYEETWRLQADLAVKRVKDLIPDRVLMLEHPSLYTAGKRTQSGDRPTNGSPVVDVGRGGRITWHGPGQLAMYPIIKLTQPVDMMDYIRRLREALIQAAHRADIAATGRIGDHSGVWVPALSGKNDRRVATLGIRVTHGVTMHGLSLNCDNSMKFYNYIIPCGTPDAGVTTLSRGLDRDVSVSEMTEPLLADSQDTLEGHLTVVNHSFSSAPNPTRDLPHQVKYNPTTDIFEYSSTKR